MVNDIDRLTHSKWRCQYHIVFVPKYRRQISMKEYIDLFTGQPAKGSK
ncbi:MULTISPECIES: transposase [Clostridium]|nr:transposase [Clostridium cadaveris]MDU4951067.1 hypothetical protein [Clostridium sp.]